MVNDTRRGPGRPPRKVISNTPIRGIVDDKEDDDNIIEFSYYDPTIFKNLFSLFKNLKARELYLSFTKDSFIIKTRDHSGNRMFIKFDCNKAIHYYCSEPINICVNRDNIQPIFINLTKYTEKLLIAYENGSNMLKIKCDE